MLQNSTAQCSRRFAGIHFRLFNFAAEQLHKHRNVHSAPHWLAPFLLGGGWKPLIHRTLVCGCLMCCLHTMPSQEIHMLFCSHTTSLCFICAKRFLTKRPCFVSAYQPSIPFEAGADIDNTLCSLCISHWVLLNVDLVYPALPY